MRLCCLCAVNQMEQLRNDIRSRSARNAQDGTRYVLLGLNASGLESTLKYTHFRCLFVLVAYSDLQPFD